KAAQKRAEQTAAPLEAPLAPDDAVMMDADAAGTSTMLAPYDVRAGEIMHNFAQVIDTFSGDLAQDK
ncbi:hypothetical protein GGF46_004851, partial [Coemansia sp. RSA 552]